MINLQRLDNRFSDLRNTGRANKDFEWSPISEKALANARRLLYELRNLLPEVYIYATMDGGLTAEWPCADQDVDVVIEWDEDGNLVFRED